MKKAMRVLLGLLCMTAFLAHGKVFAEQVGPTVSNPEAAVEVAKEPEMDIASAPADEDPIDEELKDEEVVDSDA